MELITHKLIKNTEKSSNSPSIKFPHSFLINLMTQFHRKVSTQFLMLLITPRNVSTYQKKPWRKVFPHSLDFHMKIAYESPAVIAFHIISMRYDVWIRRRWRVRREVCNFAVYFTNKMTTWDFLLLNERNQMKLMRSARLWKNFVINFQSC